MEHDERVEPFAGTSQDGPSAKVDGNIPGPESGDRGPSQPGWDGFPSGRAEMAREVFERGRDLLDKRTLRVAAVGVVVAVVGIWWFAAGAAPDASSAASGPFTSGGTTLAFATSTTVGRDATVGTATPGDQPDSDGPIVVHAAGAVVTPGVYRLPSGARVADLIAAAGGLTPDADGDRLNLAEPLADGVRVYAPRLGETETPSIQDLDEPSGPSGRSGSAGGSGSGVEGAAGDGSSVGPINLNDATIDQLDELPGVGPATAQAIIAHREQNGPFGSVDALLEVRGIGPAKLEQIRPLVVV